MSTPNWYEQNYRYFVVAGSALMLLVGTGVVYLLVTALKVIAVDFGWPRSIPSIAYAASYIGAAFGSVAMGFWLDRRGIGGPALLGAVMLGSGAILFSRIDAAWQLFFIYAVMMGFCGISTLYGPTIANIIGWFDRGRGLALGIAASGQAAAGIIWPPIFRWMIEDRGWRETAFMYGVFAMLVMLPVSRLIRKRPSAWSGAVVPSQGAAPAVGPAFSSQPQARSAMSARALQITLCIATVSCCIPMAMPVAHTVATVTDLGYSFADGANLLAVMLFASTCSRLILIGLLSARLGALGALCTFSVLQLIGVGSLALIHTLPALYLVGIMFGLGYGGLMPCYSLTLREYLPANEVGRRTGFIVFFGGLGMATGGWLAGAIFDLTGTYDYAYMVGALSNTANLTIIGTLILSRYRGYLRPVTA
ncbi:MAG: MFS transporter [Alphaproteobacteria bacterium]